MNNITTADVQFNENGNPISEKYDDIYFSKEDGLTESYEVFQNGNNLVGRWQTNNHSHFTIAETGFGTGLNFLAVCQRFINFKQTHPSAQLKKLHFISFEKFPLEKSALQTALKAWPQLTYWSNQLLAQYPYLVSGPHRIHFDGNITLDLWLGDIAEQMPQMQNVSNGFIDAWFLDGFAPSKNPDMWQQSLFNNMAFYSKPNATFSTFTAAGFVRRGLIEAGFNVEKVKGFGYKRERIQGVLIHKKNTDSAKPKWNIYPIEMSPSKKVAIVGGGIAAVTTALALVQRDFQVELYCPTLETDGASGNQQGAIYPMLQNNHNAFSEVNLKAFQFSQQYYHYWQSKFDFDADFCGLIQLAFSDIVKERQNSLVEGELWPQSVFQALDATQCSEVAGVSIDTGGLYFPDAGWINPKAFVKAAKTYLAQCRKVSIISDAELVDIQKIESHWRLKFDCESAQFETITPSVVLALSHNSRDFSYTQHLSLSPVRGQITHINSHASLKNLNTVLCHKGYLTPETNNLHCIGATYKHGQTDSQPTSQDNLSNLALQKKHLPALSDELSEKNVSGERASIRSATPDHLPMCGLVNSPQYLKKSLLCKNRRYKDPLPEVDNIGLYVLTGLGSRGLTTAPLLADCLASVMAGEGLPLPSFAIEALHPNRFIFRGLKRGLEVNS
ncbi:bifunctional tRNA (5-methylaminomethyl-2-thiouridine)(34)-methyltransferase MnmD/FAD-dependent 5-carboxymethylaminomethyl-2-thiouridine(34) oxidoreductase MnmC [Catenovulum sediminis]|uniref:bifunctional tRNA (5-methylaminomethyl-2-thiouridine)(34)-methyltransferase MnmD/FAD-dependent 5-carboxymethylaminomethyl-2-thiouridine(34) oxidoreductase MnmC n=1 Tax=Catenovulum sediminis TaxID=1740262 RepID=UPI00163D4324|nr:bifunctional tRNA (5-methylaminomethyl-2-thiouridine)(34)-methyltransferase MnmD/FAD-dependent 5-carboxymethylaminomethyl-2-thiouridine(34) oxidoreductase MnmC [Catenovulum sediminis]